MVSTDLSQLERRARLAYERGRLRRALFGVVPLVPVIAGATWLTQRPGSSLVFGAAALLAGVGMLWYGRDPQRAVLPGIAAGLVPLVLALCASQLHLCGPEGCTSLCVPACAFGGTVAGLAVARVGHRRRAGPLFWVTGSAIALLTGAMGCSCVGHSGLIGLGLGFVAGVLPGLLRPGRARA